MDSQSVSLRFNILEENLSPIRLTLQPYTKSQSPIGTPQTTDYQNFFFLPKKNVWKRKPSSGTSEKANSMIGLVTDLKKKVLWHDSLQRREFTDVTW